LGKALCAVLTVAVLCGTVAANSENLNGPEKSENAIIVAAAEGKVCPNCGEENLPDAVWCWKCGEKLPEKKAGLVYCPYCGAQISATAKYCPECGRTVKNDQPTGTESYRRTGRGPTGQSGLGMGLAALFGGGSTALNANISFDFGIGDYVALGPIVNVGTAFKGLGVSFGAGVGTRFYLIPHFNSPVQPYVSVAVGYVHTKAKVVIFYVWGFETEIRDANTIAADFSFGADFEIPGSSVAPFIAAGGGVNRVSVSGLGLSETKGFFGIGGGVRFGIW